MWLNIETGDLTLQVPITTAAEDIHKYSFFFSSPEPKAPGELIV